VLMSGGFLVDPSPDGRTVPDMPLLPGRRSNYEFESASDLERDAFLGTLRSELDDDSSLDGAFAEVHARFVTFREAYLAGRIDARAFGRELSNLRVLDEDGIQWTLGATTNRWYSRSPHNASQWMPSPAPGQGGVVVDATGQASGWAVEDWEARRAQRAAEMRERLRFEEGTGPAEPERKMSIDEMFDRYVESATDGEAYSVDQTILVVEGLDNLDDADWRTLGPAE
jgi:hypothetical protein